MAQDPWAVVSQTPVKPAKADPWAVVSTTPAKPAATAPSTPESPLITAGEGQYQMRGKDGKMRPVSYSHVFDAIHNGYNFVDRKTLDTFARDHAADPNNAEHRTDAEVAAMSNWNPLKYLAIVGKVPLDVLQGVGGEALKTATAFDKPSTSRLETELQLAADTPTEGFWQNVGAGGEQVGELAVVPESKLAEGAEVGKAAKTALTVVEQGLRAAGEQGAQQYVKSGGDTGQAKTAAEWGGAFGAVTPLAQSVLRGGARLLSESIGQRFDIDPFSVGKQLKKLDDETATVHDENLKKIKEAKDAEQAANAKRVPGTDVSHSQGKEALRSAALEHEDAAMKAAAAKTKVQIVSDALAKTRQVVMDRVQTINQAAKDYFKTNFAEIEKLLDAPDPETGNPRTVSYADLDGLVDEAEGKVKGSRANVGLFEDIGKKARGLGESAEGKTGKYAKHVLTPDELEELAPDERAMLGKYAKDGTALPGAKYSDLDGYYQEAGRIIGNPSTAPDVRQAVVEFRKLLAERMQKLADEVDPAIGKRHALLRKQYRAYAEAFKDYTGPASSGSPLALGVQAKDADNATEKYLKLSPAEARRTEQMLVGDSSKPETQFAGKTIGEQSAWKYRKQTNQLIEHMRNLQTGLERTTKAADTAQKEADDAADALAKARTKVRSLQPVQKTPVPTMTPEQLRQFKVDTLANLSHNLGKFGTWVAIGGLIGGTTGFIRGLATGKGTEGALEEGATGVVVGVITPHMLTKMLSQPKVVESLTRLSRDDLQKLMALSPAQRGPTETLVKMLADEAVREGKLTASQIPWLRILGGTAARKAGIAMQPTPTQTAPGESEQDIDKQLEEQEQTVNQ